MKKDNRGGSRVGSGRKKIDPLDKKHPITMQAKLRHIINGKVPLTDVKIAILNKREKLKELGIIK